MKFDIVRAWKDETYRQSLSEEQLNMLPANPAGELTEADLATIYGSGGGNPVGPVGPVGGAAPVAAVAPAIPVGVGLASVRNESFALICEINIFSINIIANIAILGSATQVCIKG